MELIKKQVFFQKTEDNIVENGYLYIAAPQELYHTQIFDCVMIRCECCCEIITYCKEIFVCRIDNKNKYCVVSQTTLNLELYNTLVNELSKNIDNITFKNTICSATKTRQQAAKELSVDVDCMIVIGGKHSSNTQKLVNICKDQVPTFAIETKDDLDIQQLKSFSSIGVTAGASTPDWIIDDVMSFIESL